MMDLTIPQTNIWNLQTYYKGTSIVNNCGAVIFEKHCDAALLRQAINKIIELQDGLRLQFCEKNGQPFQYCKAYTESIDIPYKNFSTWQAFETFGQKYSKIPMDGLDQPVYRFLIFDVENKSGVFLCASHLISDAWSIGIIAGKIGEYYDLLEQNKEITDKEHSYMSFCKGEQEYLNSEKYSKDEAFWLDAYQEQPSVAFIKPAKGLAKKPEANRYSYLLSKEQTQTIDTFCKEHRVSQAVLFECAIILYLSKINSENANITIGIPVLNRTGREEKNAIGMCISTTPLSVTLNPKLTVKELFEIVTAKHFQIFRHQKFPYAHLLKKLHDKHHFSGNLYDVMVSFQNAKMDSPIEAKTKWFGNGYCEVGLAWHVDNRDKKDHYTINVDYQTDLFQDEQEIEYLTQRMFYILEQMIHAPQSCIEAVEIVSQAEKIKMIAGFNDTFCQYQSEQCVHGLFAEQVRKNPDKVALVFQNQSFTYQQLDEKSNVLAGILKEKGICRGDIVPIISKRSWHVIAAMLGILKAGAAYMPVDPTFPKDRIEYMLELSEAKICLTYGYQQRLKAETLDLEEVNYDAVATNIPFVSQPNDPCYVIFTSGSTGKPKGVCLTHRNVCNYANANPNNIVVNCLAKNRKSIVSTTNIIFDIFVTESLMPLLNGVTIYLADDQQAVSQKLLNQLIVDNQIEVLQTTPTKMRAYLADKNEIQYLTQLKTIILGGEALTADLYTQIRKNSNAQIYNMYGPTETTVWSTNKEVTDADITIGKPIANTQIYILDEHQKVVPIGIAGELCIAGDGVGMGYVNRPDLTQERFIDNPFCAGTKMYRTGDLACWRNNGEIEYLGRIDTQVKIRGLRIELGEIESVMNEYPNIQIAAATDQKDDTGRQYLVGYYVAKGKVDEKELRQHLLAKLPKYMVPNYFVELETMPMTASGKIDRKNLPVPQINTVADDYIAPVTDQEVLLCKVLEELFEMEKISVTDDFFEIGGDSLRAIEYVAKAHHQGIELSLQDIFDYPTVRQMCEHLAKNCRKKVCYGIQEFQRYEKLLARNQPRKDFCKQKKALGNVFITGATGFLGAHIVYECLQNDAEKIYCLVRGGQERLQSTLRYYFDDLFDELMGSKIIALEGDITRTELSKQLPDDIQTVIHSAATVKHYGSSKYFEQVNVEGTQNVVNYAEKVKAQLIHISTLSVSGNSLVDAFEMYRSEQIVEFYETNFYMQQPLDNVYIHSKFWAERVVLEAMLRGLNAKIVRVGNLTNRISDLKFQMNYQSNAFLTRVKAALELGVLPDYLLDIYAEFSPVDQTAEGVVKIAQYGGDYTVFHLNSNRVLYFDRMVEILNLLGVKMQVVSADQFHEMLQESLQQTKTEYIYEAFQNDLDGQGRLVYDSNIHIMNDFTVWFMKQVGFEWAEIDLEYMEKYLNYFRELGYFEV